MALPTSRLQLINYCLRELGSPVVQIAIAEDQIDDRVDECLAYFRDYHFDGVEHAFHLHKVTCSKLTFVSAITGTFQEGENITGGTSGAKATFVDQADDNLSLRFRYVFGQTATFQDGEVITGEQSGATGTLASSNSVLLGDLDNRYITLPDEIISVVDFLPFNTTPANSASMFDVRYQFALHDMYNLISADLVTYDMFKKHLALWQFEFSGTKGYHFNRVTDKLFLDVDWERQIMPDMILVFEVWGAVDPEAHTKVYSELFVRKYCTALFKRQWGTNLKKYSGVALVGGLTFNGQQIYNEANLELQQLEQRISREWQLPTDFQVG